MREGESEWGHGEREERSVVGEEGRNERVESSGERIALQSNPS